MPAKKKKKTLKPRYTKDDFADLDGRDIWHRDGSKDKARGWLLWLRKEDRLELVLAGATVDPIAISNHQLANIGDSESHKIQLINSDS